jgi:hypothetical protein
MDWNSFKIIVDIFNILVTTGAIIIGGIWAYKKLFIEAEHETSITVSLNCKLLNSNRKNLKILEIRAIVNNNGKIPCQIDLPNSRIFINIVNINEDLMQFVAQEEEYLSLHSFKESGVINIPVGASANVVDFTPIEHPGIYRVEVFLAQTKQAGKKFYRRIGEPFPDDWDENPSGWSDEIILNTTESIN